MPFGFTSAGIAIVTLNLAVTGCLFATPAESSRSEIETKSDATSSPALATGAYFSLKLPGEKPELFAPDIINIPGRSVGRIAFSPDATECAFTVFESMYAHNRILCTRFENGAWTPQTPLTGVEGREMLEPLFSRDNSRLYFAVKSADASPNVDFWEMQRVTRGWSKPRRLPDPLNSDQNEFCLAQTADGTMYFASARANGHGGLDLYRTVSKPGQPVQVENLGMPVNSASDDGDPGISPDGHTLVFYSEANRPRHTGNSDLFICFDNGKGGWTNPVNLGEGFNTPAAEYAATFSQDGLVLFFVRFDGNKGEVYWVSTKGLERFRKQSETTNGLQEPPVQLPSEIKTVHVPPEILQRYVGTYVLQSPPGLTNHVTLEADQLSMQMTGQPKIPVFAESETKFFLKVVEAQVEFAKNDQGEVTDLIIHQNGMKIKMARKIEASTGEPEPQK